MSVFNRFGLIFLILLLFSCKATEAKVLPGMEKSSGENSIMTNKSEYIFSLSSALSESEIKKAFEGFGFSSLTEINKTNLSYKIVFQNDPGLKALEENLLRHPKFRFIERNSILKKSKN